MKKVLFMLSILMATTIALTSCEKEVTPNGTTKNLSTDTTIARESSPFNEYVGDEISLAEFNDYTDRFQDAHPNWPQSFQADNADLDELLVGTGVAIFYAIDSELNGYHVLSAVIDTTISNTVVYKSTPDGLVTATEAEVSPDIERFIDMFPDWKDGQAAGRIIVDDIRNQSGAYGVTFYNAMPDEYSSTLCLVGYDFNNDDIAGMYADHLRGFHTRKKNKPLGGGGVNTGGTAAGGAAGIGGILTGPIPQ